MTHHQTFPTTKPHPAVASIRAFVLVVVCGAFLAGCATVPLPPTEARHHQAALELRAARSTRHSLDERLGHYVRAAEEAAPLLGETAEPEAVRNIYNAAVAEFTILLRSAEGGRRWNQPLTITAGGRTYRLRYAPESRREGTWAPGYFTAFETPQQVHEERLALQVRDEGFGGTLVGINRPPDPRQFYFPSVGVAGAATAVLAFQSAPRNPAAPREVILSLHDPTVRETVRLAGATRPLAADFTAPLAYYPSPRFLGLKEAMRVDRYYETAGLELLQPYDPERIPIVCVHGLISQPGMWRDTIDAVESDPELRGRFQFWAFGYPTGDPISISALQFREASRAFTKCIRAPRTWC